MSFVSGGQRGSLGRAGVITGQGGLRNDYSATFKHFMQTVVILTSQDDRGMGAPFNSYEGGCELITQDFSKE